MIGVRVYHEEIAGKITESRVYKFLTVCFNLQSRWELIYCSCRMNVIHSERHFHG